MARAAHCIQLLPRRALNLNDQREFEYEYPEEYDSSDPEESSGDESRDDGPGPDVPTTRRPRNEDERNEMRLKRARHEQRVQAAYDKIRNRRNAIEARRAQGIQAPREENDPLAERHADFMFMEICANGDLENLLYR